MELGGSFTMGSPKNWLMVILGIGILSAGLILYNGDPIALFFGFFNNLGGWIADIPFVRRIFGAP